MKRTRGFIALTTVLILSALFLSVGISIASRALSASTVSIALAERDRARYRAEACAERALMELQRTLDYTGNERVLVEDGSCDILSIMGNGNTNRTIHTVSTIGAHTYRIQAVVSTVSPKMVVTSFERVVNF